VPGSSRKARDCFVGGMVCHNVSAVWHTNPLVPNGNKTFDRTSAYIRPQNGYRKKMTSESGDNNSGEADGRKDRKRDRRSGKYQKEYSDNELIGAVHKLQIASTKEVADEVGGKPDQVRDRLKKIEEDGGPILSKMKGRSLIWIAD